MIVVEATSPTSHGVDTGTQVTDHFRLPRVKHYRIVDLQHRRLLHYRRAGARIYLSVIANRPLALDPPGFRLRVDDIFS